MKKEMEDFELRFAEALSGSVLPMDEVLRYVEAARGKRLRPRLVLLTASLFGEINDTTRRTALFVEMLHTATLVHDDVVDGSDTRRGQPSVNARWNSRVAVLAGDHLLAKAIRLLSNPEDHLILKEMLDVAMMMSEGELMQNAECGTAQPSTKLIRNSELASGANNSAFRIPNSEFYLDVISRKTALLLRACCVGGALSVGASQEVIDKIGEFGLNFGLVFQMRDDILDHDSEETTALAEQLIPEYLDKTLKALDALAPYTINKEALSSLRELTVFCATRES